MTLISRVWNSLVGGTSQTRTNQVAPKQATPATTPDRGPQDSFTFGGVIQSPLMAEMEQMARELAASAPSPKAQAAPNIDVLASTESGFKAHYGEAIDKKLKAKGFDPLTRSEKASVSRAYQVGAQKLGVQTTVGTAAEVMTQNTSQDEVRALTGKHFRDFSIPAMPASHFENVPVHLSKDVSIAASGPQAIYLNPIVANIPESPFKQFLMGHEKHHVDAKDSLKQLGYFHLKNQLVEIPQAFFQADEAIQQAERPQEFAADRAGVDQALRNYSPAEAKSTINELLGVFKDQGESDSHPATAERIKRVSAHIDARTKQPTKTQQPLFTPVVSNPIFDELAKMASQM